MKTYRVILDVTLDDNQTHPKEWVEDAVRDHIASDETVKIVTIVEPELMVGKALTS